MWCDALSLSTPYHTISHNKTCSVSGAQFTNYIHCRTSCTCAALSPQFLISRRHQSRCRDNLCHRSTLLLAAALRWDCCRSQAMEHCSLSHRRTVSTDLTSSVGAKFFFLLFFYLFFLVLFSPQGHKHIRILSKTEYKSSNDWFYLMCSRIINLFLPVYILPGNGCVHILDH